VRVDASRGAETAERGGRAVEFARHAREQQIEILRGARRRPASSCGAPRRIARSSPHCDARHARRLRDAPNSVVADAKNVDCARPSPSTPLRSGVRAPHAAASPQRHAQIRGILDATFDYDELTSTEATRRHGQPRPPPPRISPISSSLIWSRPSDARAMAWLRCTGKSTASTSLCTYATARWL